MDAALPLHAAELASAPVMGSVSANGPPLAAGGNAVYGAGGLPSSDSLPTPAIL